MEKTAKLGLKLIHMIKKDTYNYVWFNIIKIRFSVR